MITRHCFHDFITTLCFLGWMSAMYAGTGPCLADAEAQVSALGLDYDGDGFADPALVINGDCYLWLSTNGYLMNTPFDLGLSGGTFTAGDLDGDGTNDVAMVSGELWYTWGSASGYAPLGPYNLNMAGTPFIGNFDGDGFGDPAVMNQDGLFVCFSKYGYQASGPFAFNATGTPLAADLDLDGCDDLILVNQNLWTVFYSSLEYLNPVVYDLATTGLPLAADFDNDERYDPAIYDPVNGWYCWMSSGGYLRQGPYQLTPGYAPVAYGLADMVSNTTHAAVYVGDELNVIPDAKVFLNEVVLTYGLPVVFTNEDGRLINLSLPLYYGATTSLTAGADVVLTVTAASGATIYQSAAYTMPSPVQIVSPTNGQNLAAGQDQTIRWSNGTNAAGFLVGFLALDATNINSDKGLVVKYVPNSTNETALDGSEFLAGTGVVGVAAVNGDVTALQNDIDTPQSFFLLGNEDDVTITVEESHGASGAAKGQAGLGILREYSKSFEGLSFKMRDGNPQQIQQPGNVTIVFKLRRLKMSVAFIKAFDMNGGEYFSWQKKRVFKTSDKTYTVSFSVSAGTTVVFGTHDASYRSGVYSY
ncbi:MAG: VCBS repeat-containing protein [Kiritimatiellae bacterium]|nr:VCBS repeat-containing protein [Kiritimatiellia bacterium]